MRRLTLEIQRLNHPGISTQTFKALTNSGKLTKRYGSQAIINAVSLNLKNAVSASLSVTGSTFDGTIKTIAIGIYEDLSENDR